MADQNRFRSLQMRIGRHGRIRGLFRAIHQDAAQFREFVPQLINRRAHVQSQVGRNLLIAAAPAVQLVSRFADQRDQLLLDEMMNVFRFTVVKKCRRRSSAFADLLQALQNADQFVRRKNAGILQRTRMRAAGGEFVTPATVDRS